MRQVITTLCRILTGLLFIFSGFIKANDPKGFGIKLNEYFSIFSEHIPAFRMLMPASDFLSMFICVLEIFLGIALLIGAYRKFTVWALLLMIIFFTFLTFYSAWFDKVTDCGCFGDAVKLTPWQSFWKDIILLVMILVIFVNRNYLRPLFGRRTGRGIALAGATLSAIFTFGAWYFLPPIDFRPYKVGNDIQQQMTLPPDAKKDIFESKYIYQKDGVKKEFSIDSIPDTETTDWEFVETMTEQTQIGDKPAIHDFDIYDKEGESLKDSFLAQQGYRLMIIHYDIEKAREASQKKLNQLYTDLKADGRVAVWPLSGSIQFINDKYKADHAVPYNYLTADVTMLKTIIRSNPGLVLLKDNVVIAKWPSTYLPDKEEIFSKMQ